MMNRKVPFTTRSGLQIGKYYEPPRHMVVSGDMEDLQTALLFGPRKPPLRVSLMTRFSRFFANHKTA